MKVNEIEDIPVEPEKQNKITASVLDAFDFLKRPKEEEKIIGSLKILSLIQDEKEKDLQYIIKRLIRSLGANDPDMRIGYFATLVNFMSKFQTITVAQVLDLVQQELHASNSSKSEVGDVALGRILVCCAIFRSGLMLRAELLKQHEIISILITAANKKSYLRIIAYMILIDFIEMLNEEQFETIVWPNLKPELKKDIGDHNLDSLYLLHIVNKKFPKKVKFIKLIGFPDLLCEDTVETISDKLMAGIDYNSLNHPIYKEISILAANSIHLKNFWNSIDSKLIKHNRNRELVSINILTNIFTNINNNYDIIPQLLSKNFFKLFLDWFKGLQTASKVRKRRDDEEDHKIMIKKERDLLNALAKVLKSEQVNSAIRVATLKALLFSPGEMNFTEISGTNIVKSIISDLDQGGIIKMAKLLKGVLLNTSKKFIKDDLERSWYNNERLKAAETISYLVNHESVKDHIEFKIANMKLLMCFGFFKLGGDENVAVNTELSGAIKCCFYRCFATKFTNVDSLLLVLSSLANFISTTLKTDNIRVKIEKQFPKDNIDHWEILIDICHTIDKKKNKSKVEKVFLILLYQLGLFLFSEPKYIKMASDSIKELKSCFEHYMAEKDSKTKTEDTDDEPEWIEVLTEVLLSILSSESGVLRSVVQCVFRLLWEYLTPSCINQIISVLDPDNEENPLINETSDDESDDEDDRNSKSDENDDGEDDDDDSHESELDDEEMKAPDQLRMAVQKALGSAAPESDTESVDADMIGEEEGKRLDDALAEAFKQFHQGKKLKTKKDRKDKKALSDFRLRVLDLIDIYLEKEPAMDICLNIMPPLMRALEFSIQDNQFNELASRLRKTIKNLTKIRKFSSNEGITQQVLCDYLKATIDKGARSHFMFQALGDVITQFSTFIIHCSLKIEKDAKSELFLVFKESFENFFRNRNCLLPIIFFHNVLQLDWDENINLLPIVIESVFNGNVRQFRRNEALDLTTGYFRALKRLKPTSKKMLKKIAELEKLFENTVTNNLNSGIFEAKNNFLMTLKKLVNTIKVYHESCKSTSSIDFKKLSDLVTSCKGVSKCKTANTSNNNNVKQEATSNKKNKRRNNQINGHHKSKKIKM